MAADSTPMPKPPDRQPSLDLDLGFDPKRAAGSAGARPATEPVPADLEPPRPELRRPSGSAQAARSPKADEREPAWWRRAREATKTPPAPVPPVSFANLWRGLLLEEGWTLELSAGHLASLESLVRGFDIRPGVVEASIGGGREKPHRVQLRLAPFAAAEWARLARKLADDTEEAALNAELDLGRIPLALVEACDACGLSLVPRRLALVAAACTCGGARLPCDHVLATQLKLARRLGTEPLALVALRGGPKAELVGLVARVRAELARAPVLTQARPADPFAAPAPLRLDWAALAAPAPTRPVLPPLEGWRPSESFDAL